MTCFQRFIRFWLVSAPQLLNDSLDHLQLLLQTARTKQRLFYEEEIGKDASLSYVQEVLAEGMTLKETEAGT